MHLSIARRAYLLHSCYMSPIQLSLYGDPKFKRMHFHFVFSPCQVASTLLVLVRVTQ
jgi:hypothetical protein